MIYKITDLKNKIEQQENRLNTELDSIKTFFTSINLPKLTEILKQRKKDLDQIPSSMNLISPTIHQSIEKLRKEYTVALEELDLAQKYFHLSKV